MKAIISVVIGISLASTLVGCGSGASLSQSPLQSRSVDTTLEADGLPSIGELERMRAASPQGLIDDASADPGVSAEGLWPAPPPGDLGNMGQLNAKLYRGARPTEAGVRKLRDMGVKTLISLESTRKIVEQEERWAKQYGLTFVSIPMGLFAPPATSKVKKFLAIATDPAQQPVYFHCMQGRDRTGVMAFAHRISVDGWNYERAYAEMKDYGFHTILLGLKGYVYWYAKLNEGRKAAALVF